MRAGMSQFQHRQSGRSVARSRNPSAPWIPAFAGMTELGAGLTELGAGLTKLGAGLTKLGAGLTELGAGMTEAALRFR